MTDPFPFAYPYPAPQHTVNAADVEEQHVDAPAQEDAPPGGVAQPGLTLSTDAPPEDDNDDGGDGLAPAEDADDDQEG